MDPKCSSKHKAEILRLVSGHEYIINNSTGSGEISCFSCEKL